MDAYIHRIEWNKREDTIKNEKDVIKYKEIIYAIISKGGCHTSPRTLKFAVEQDDTMLVFDILRGDITPTADILDIANNNHNEVIQFALIKKIFTGSVI